jgi:hypothetical protein
MRRDQVESYMLQHLPADVQKAQQQPLQPRRGTPIATAFRSWQLSGPRVSLQRYSLADQWTQSMREFWQGPQPEANSSSGASDSTKQQQQQMNGDASGSSSDATSVAAAVQGLELASDANQGVNQAIGAAAASAGSRFVLPQDRPIVAVVTAAGPIMQASSGGPESTGQTVESNKLVRVLRSYRENPQVILVHTSLFMIGASGLHSTRALVEEGLAGKACLCWVASRATVSGSSHICMTDGPHARTVSSNCAHMLGTLVRCMP